MNSYGKLSTTFYDLDKPQPPPDALAFYTLYAQSAGGPILEPMCGSGRFLIPLMQQGFMVTGVDASFAMLAACRQRALSMGLEPRLILQYLHHMILPGVFRFAIIPSGSFCLLTDPSEARLALLRIFQCLAPRSAFCVEIDQWLEPQADTTAAGERFVQRQDGARIVMHSFGAMDATALLYQGTNQYVLIQDDQVIETEWEQFNLRYYQPEAFAALLEEAGFMDIRYHGSYDPHQPIEQSESLVFISTRP